VLVAGTGLVPGRLRVREIDDDGWRLLAWLARWPNGELVWIVRQAPTGR